MATSILVRPLGRQWPGILHVLKLLALALTADGRLVVAAGDGNLYELDPVTGASTLLGPTGVEVVGGMSLRVLR